MNLHKPFARLAALFPVLVVVFLSVQDKCHASPFQQQEQQQSQQSPPPSSAAPTSSQPAPDPATSIGPLPVKRRKVWTNDDVVVLRTPTDNYLAEKEAKQAAEAEAAAKEAAAMASAEKEAPLGIKLPATVEETEKALQTARDDVQEETVILAQMYKELPVAPSEQQTEKQKDIDRLTANIDTSQRKVKALQQHLQALRAKSHSENPPAPSEPQPPSA
jgi:hypothetical protein